MSLSLFIARRLYRDTDGGKQVSRPAVLIAMVGIAIGLAVMIITVAVVLVLRERFVIRSLVSDRIFRSVILMLSVPLKHILLW